MIIFTPINMYFIYLVIKFCLMGLRLYGLVNDKPSSKVVKSIFIAIGSIFVMHYQIDIFLYLYPFIYRYKLVE